MQAFFVPDIDLFASRLNKQMDSFVSWYPEPGVMHCNAFTISWHNLRACKRAEYFLAWCSMDHSC